MLSGLRIVTESDNPVRRDFHDVKPSKPGKGLQAHEALAVVLALVYHWILCPEKLHLDIHVSSNNIEYPALLRLTQQNNVTPEAPPEMEELNATEKAVLIYTAKGLKQHEIAEIEHITPAGVKQCRHRLYGKLKLKSSIASLVAYAMKYRWLI